MALISPDYSEVVEVVPGAYRARVVDVEAKTSQAGNSYLRWKLELEGNSDTRVNGRTLQWSTMVTGRGAGGLKNLIRATLNSSYDGGSFDTNDVLGKSIQIVVKDGTDKEGNKTGFPEVATVSRLKDASAA